MDILNKAKTKEVDRPIKVLQFGEGNFLRAFVDYMIDVANERKVFDGNIGIVKPISYGNLDIFKKQDCKYTLSLRGKENGETCVINRVITSVSDILGVYEEYDKYISYAHLDSLRFVVSNTTEAGIVYDEKDSFSHNPPGTFPGKLTKLLYERFSFYKGDKEKGLIMIPCELIENNGKALKNCILQFAALWQLEKEFVNWIEEACIFCSTLVDRIVTGYPKDEILGLWEKLGYQDELLVTGEIFGLWVIESEKDISKELPLDKAGLPVIFTNNQAPYRERKVRILNGAHTSFVLASYLAGNDYVLESMEDKDIRKFMEETVFEEIIPTLSLPIEELNSFANSVIERFENPFIKHALLSISLNSVSKWKTRCLPSFREYYNKFHQLPKCLTFSLAALLSFYRSENLENNALIGKRGEEAYKIMDDEAVLDFFASHSKLNNEDFVTSYLGHKEFFGEDMLQYEGLKDCIKTYVDDIEKEGVREALRKVLEQS